MRNSTIKTRTSIRKRSSKARRRARVCAKLRKEKVLWYGRACCVCSPVCTGTEEGLHHVVKKSQGGEDTHRNTMLCCVACNLYIEDHPAWALANGFAFRREAFDTQHA